MDEEDLNTLVSIDEDAVVLQLVDLTIEIVYIDMEVLPRVADLDVLIPTYEINIAKDRPH